MPTTVDFLCHCFSYHRRRFQQVRGSILPQSNAWLVLLRQIFKAHTSNTSPGDCLANNSLAPGAFQFLFPPSSWSISPTTDTNS